MYRVIRSFRDLQDNHRLYRVGDPYPAEGCKASRARIAELKNGTNAAGLVFIEKV